MSCREGNHGGASPPDILLPPPALPPKATWEEAAESEKKMASFCSSDSEMLNPLLKDLVCICHPQRRFLMKKMTFFLKKKTGRDGFGYR